MKYWSNDKVLERDIVEGESIFDSNNPHPAYRGMKLLSTGEDYLYEVEIVPGTERKETIIDPTTFNAIIGNVIDVVYRKWNDDAGQWDEATFPSLLSSWGYTNIPSNKKAKKLTAFDRAMKGI